jgi:predicted permease
MTTWKYLPVLNACLQIISTVCLGAISRILAPSVFDSAFVQHSVQFVFYIAIPCLVVKGIGVGVDFYSEAITWKYIAAFLLLRAFVLLFAAAFHLLRRNRNETKCGTIAVYWLSLTWISTVILGIPILTAVTNSPKKGRSYGILAGISSFVFQLPFQIFLFECHKFERDHLNIEEMDSCCDVPQDLIGGKKEGDNDGRKVKVDSSRSLNWTKFTTSKELWKFILSHMGHNPIILGIVFGFVISLSTFGKRFLNPFTDDKTLNDSYVEWLKFLVDTLGWFGDCASPLSLFSMGIWMQDQGGSIITVGFKELTLFMLLKLVLVPLLMVGLANALQLNDESGRAAVLIAALPISIASFSLGNTYQVGEAQLSANVVVGTALMLPTIIIWNYAMDEIGLFTIF